MREWRNLSKNLVILNSKKIFCLSGWGQKFDSLENIFSESFFVSSFDYSRLNSVEKFFDEIARLKIDADVFVGWSLGGQLLVRLIEKKIIKPKLLVLIAPPFQMIKDEKVQAGMSKKTFDEFYKNFTSAPGATLKQFSILTSMNDRNSKEIASTLDVSSDNFENLKYWLEELERFSCFDVDFLNMPRTLFYQGLGDMIVHVSQCEYFKARIKDFRLEVFEKCGHAPHLSDLAKFKKIFCEELELLK